MEAELAVWRVREPSPERPGDSGCGKLKWQRLEPETGPRNGDKLGASERQPVMGHDVITIDNVIRGQ